MKLANRVVAVVLRSPLHRLLSGSTDVVRYRGRRTGHEFETPTQYVEVDDGLVIVVARAGSKAWWRNFVEDRDLDVLVRGSWRPMTGRAMSGASEPEVVAPLLDAYLARFPRAERALPGATRAEQVEQAVVVWCRPR